jgi:hypothetical protein
MKKKVPRVGPPPDAYAFALEEERRAWQVLQGMPRSDPRYAQALAEWQAAADRIGAVAEELLKRQPKP